MSDQLYRRIGSDGEARTSQYVPVELRPVGGMYEHPWYCSTCGTDHGESGCDNPDFGKFHQWYEIVEANDGE